MAEDVVGGNRRESPGTIQGAAIGPLPRAVRFRARYVPRNTPTGNYSDTVNFVTVLYLGEE